MPTSCRRALLVLLAVAGAGCLGCAHSGPAPRAHAPAFDDRAAARSVVLCTTTEAELRRQFGAPVRDGILHRARIMSWVTRWESPSRYLAVMLDDHGVVVDLYWDVPTEVPWVPTDQCHGR